MSSTNDYFTARYHAVTDQKYDGWFLPNGILEIGRVLGPDIVGNILKGCLPAIPIPDDDGSFQRIMDDMERGKLLVVRETTIEDVTERGTSVFALSYRHLRCGTDELPRRRMTARQKSHLLHAVTEMAVTRNSTRVILWIDQAMGQRNPKDERDWVRHGILPYFAFDILILLEEYDLTRCWIFLENVIAQKTSLPKKALPGADLLEKSYRYGTFSPIQEVASSVLGGVLVEKRAYQASDKEQIRRWAAQLLEQNDRNGVKFADLLGGNSWKSRNYNAKALVRIINNHTVPEGEVTWRDLTAQNKHCRFHGLSELLGLPDVETTSHGPVQARDVMKKMGIRYIFHVFSARSEASALIKAVAIGTFCRSGRPSRTILCALDGAENREDTHVLSSCILDCNELRDSGALAFIQAYSKFDNQYLGLWKKLRNSHLTYFSKSELGALHSTLLSQLLKWKWFCSALQEAGIVLDCFLESVQAGDIQWG